MLLFKMLYAQDPKGHWILSFSKSLEWSKEPTVQFGTMISLSHPGATATTGSYPASTLRLANRESSQRVSQPNWKPMVAYWSYAAHVLLKKNYIMVNAWGTKQKHSSVHPSASNLSWNMHWYQTGLHAWTPICCVPGHFWLPSKGPTQKEHSKG